MVFKEWFEIGISKVKNLQPGINNFLTLKDFDSKEYTLSAFTVYYQLLNPFGKKITDTPERDYYFVTLSETTF